MVSAMHRFAQSSSALALQQQNAFGLHSFFGSSLEPAPSEQPSAPQHVRTPKCTGSSQAPKLAETILDPSPPMFEGFARNRIGATKPSPTYGPLHRMEATNFIRIKDIATILPSRGRRPFPNMPNEKFNATKLS